MRKHSKKLIAAVVGTAAAVAVSGVAYAWWTSAGSGTGSGSTSNASSTSTLTVTGSLDDTLLVPGAPATNMTLVVKNLKSYSASLKDDTVAISSVTCDADGAGTAAPVAVPDSWFTIVDGTITSETVVPAGSLGTTLKDADNIAPHVSGVTVKFNDDPAANQNVCQHAAVAFNLTASQPTTLP
jgi:hypothetical protein